MFERITSYIQNRPRRSLAMFLSGVLLLLLINWLIQILQNGTLIIKTNDPSNTIALSRLGTAAAPSQSQGYLKAAVRAGDYTVRVNSRFSTSKRVVHVTARQKSTYQIDLREPIETESVLPLSATNLVAGDSVMYYVDMINHQLYRLGGDGLPASVNNSVTFSSIRWQNEHYGVGIDQAGTTLYAINDGVITPLSLPFSGQQVYYSLAPQGRLVISDGRIVYSKSPGGAFEKLYSSKGQISSLDASNSNVLLRFKAPSDSGGDETETIVVDSSGKKIAGIDNFSAYSKVWSPDGKYLAVTSDNATVIYDSRLKQVARLADGNVLGLSWLNNSVVLYGNTSQLMSYDLSSRTSAQLADSGIGNGISGIYKNVSGSQIYLLVSTGSQKGYEIQRVGLSTKAQNVPDYYHTLGIFFPSHTDQCSFDYTNFLRPFILITAWTNPDTCLDAAKEELKAFNLPIGGFSIVFQPSDDESAQE